MSNTTTENNNLSTFPAVTQRALEKLNTAKINGLMHAASRKPLQIILQRSASVALKWTLPLTRKMKNGKRSSVKVRA